MLTWHSAAGLDALPVARHLARTCWLLRNWPPAC